MTGPEKNLPMPIKTSRGMAALTPVMPVQSCLAPEDLSGLRRLLYCATRRSQKHLQSRTPRVWGQRYLVYLCICQTKCPLHGIKIPKQIYDHVENTGDGTRRCDRSEGNVIHGRDVCDVITISRKRLLMMTDHADTMTLETFNSQHILLH